MAFDASKLLAGGAYLLSAAAPSSSEPSELVVSIDSDKRGVFGALGKLYVDGSDAVAGSDYTITMVLTPSVGQAIVARGVVKCRGGS